MARLRIGDHAPDFQATTHSGATLRLSDVIGRQGLVIFFYPRDGTAVCTREACAFRDSYERFTEAGFAVVGVSGDSHASHQSFVDQNRLPFPLISDSDGSLRRAFGVPDTLGLLPRRVTFVIDKQGIIRLVYSALLASDEHVRRALEAVNSSN